MGLRSNVASAPEGAPSSCVVQNLDTLFHQCSGCVSFCSSFQTGVRASGSVTQRQRVCCMSSLNSSALSSCPGALFAASFDVKGFSFVLQWRAGLSGVSDVMAARGNGHGAFCCVTGVRRRLC